MKLREAAKYAKEKLKEWYGIDTDCLKEIDLIQIQRLIEIVLVSRGQSFILGLIRKTDIKK